MNSDMPDAVKSVEVVSATLPGEIPCLGALQAGEEPNDQEYFRRGEGGTVYLVFDRSVLVKVTTDCGVEGWGETCGLVAPSAGAEIMHDLLEGFLIGRDPASPSSVYDDLYGLMRGEDTVETSTAMPWRQLTLHCGTLPESLKAARWRNCLVAR